MKLPWFRHVVGGQGRSSDDVEQLANTLLIALACVVVVVIALACYYL